MRVLPELLRSMAEYQELFFSALVIIVVMFFPGGLIELLRRGATLLVKPNTQRGFEPKVREVAPPEILAAPTAVSPEKIEPLLVVEAIDKHFDALHAVNSANLIVSVGGIHGLIGPNGAGKTSLFNIISGFLDADRGHVEFAGTSLLELQARDRIRLGITRTFQHVAVFGQLSCVDNVVIGRGRNAVIHSMNESFGYFVGGAGVTAARREALVALDSVGLASQAYSPAGALSLGDQRRLEIARAIVSNPRLIMLDEPVSGVAESEVEELRQLLLRINAERKIAMLVVEHNIPFVAQLCRTMSVMGAGCIVAEGTPADVISLPTVRQLYFGEEISQ
jgi:branched-chain amino acid transport system permease protein